MHHGVGSKREQEKSDQTDQHSAKRDFAHGPG
jgi:hypothetical protein